jgi:NAD(P)-dependent dehydrogenase (short-subunit alcohol dehydrogenase family)
MSGSKDKVVAITHASSGIGEATALLLAERGAKVVHEPMISPLWLGSRASGTETRRAHQHRGCDAHLLRSTTGVSRTGRR